MRSNESAPEKLAALFEPHMHILHADADAIAEGLMKKEPALTLDDFQDVLEGYRKKASDVRLMCCNAVRTGIYRCVKSAT